MGGGGALGPRGSVQAEFIDFLHLAPIVQRDFPVLGPVRKALALGPFGERFVFRRKGQGGKSWQLPTVDNVSESILGRQTRRVCSPQKPSACTNIRFIGLRTVVPYRK